MNKQQREKRFSDALAFSNRYQRADNAEEATSLVLLSAALSPLGYTERRRLLRWALSAFGIKPEELG